jgi:hypothetical protein
MLQVAAYSSGPDRKNCFGDDAGAVGVSVRTDYKNETVTSRNVTDRKGTETIWTEYLRCRA